MPSLTINTNADFGDADTKKALMTKLTQVVAKGLGKPDSYVAIQINDKQVAFSSCARAFPRACVDAQRGNAGRENKSGPWPPLMLISLSLPLSLSVPLALSLSLSLPPPPLSLSLSLARSLSSLSLSLSPSLPPSLPPSLSLSDYDVGRVGRGMCAVPRGLARSHQPQKQQGRMQRSLPTSIRGPL
jgi:phenylpyruvate tautomerase PptA (4-oxalocrotonate tautomerase family)